jgi:hypothetical protein
LVACHFTYSDLELVKTSVGADEALEFCLSLSNSGDRDGEEVVQVYL